MWPPDKPIFKAEGVNKGPVSELMSCLALGTAPLWQRRPLAPLQNEDN